MRPARLSDTFEQVRVRSATPAAAVPAAPAAAPAAAVPAAAPAAAPAPIVLNYTTAAILKEGLIVKEASECVMAASENVLKSGGDVLQASSNVKAATDIVLQATADVMKAYENVNKIAASVTDTRDSMQVEVLKCLVDVYTFERITDYQRGPGITNTYAEFIAWNTKCVGELSANELVAISTLCKMIARNRIRSVDTEYCAEMSVDSLYFNSKGILCLANPR
jgi:hypothetical protein